MSWRERAIKIDDDIEASSSGSWRSRAVPVESDSVEKKPNPAPDPLSKDFDVEESLKRSGVKVGGNIFDSETPIGEMIPVVGPLIRKGTNAALAAGQYVLGKGQFSQKSFGDYYDENEARSEQQEKSDYEKHPESMAMKAGLAGMATPLKNPSAGLGLTGMASKVTTPVVGQAARIAAPAAENYAMTYADARLRGLSPKDAHKQAEITAALSAKMSGGIEAAKLAGKAYSRFVAGIKPKDLADYRADREGVNALQPHQAYEEMADAADDMRNRAETTKLNAESQARSREENARWAAMRDKEDAYEEARKIETRAKESQAADLAKADELQRGVAENLSRAQAEARKAVNQSAYEAMKIAEESGANIKIAPFKASLTERLNSFNVGNTRMGSGVEMLEKLRERLDDIGVKEIPASEFRTLIKSLDDDIETIYSSTAKAGHISPAQRELMGVRHGWKEKMAKEVPGYADQQAKTAGKTQALKALQDQFDATPDEIYRQLKNIDDLGRVDRMKAIEAFESEFGYDFKKTLAEAEALRNKDYSPEFEKAAALKKQDFSSPYKMDFDIAEGIKQQGINRSHELAGLGKGITNEDTARAFMEKFGRDPDKWLGKQKQMQAMALEQGLPEDYYTKMSRRLGLKLAMEGGKANGSRLVNFGRTVGEASGLGKVGTVLGASIGLVSDVIGKDVVKKFVDIADTPRGQAWLRGMKAAADRGPQAIGVWHGLQMRNDPEYRKLMEQQ